jgi:signal transduction histidine kinase
MTDELARQLSKHREITAMVAHEMRNTVVPLTYGIQLLDRCDQETCRRVRLSLQLQIRHLLRFIDDLSDFTTWESNGLQLEKARVDLLEVMQQAADIAGPAIASKHHRLLVEGDVYAPVMLDGDTQRLVQVVANILINAAKFSPEPGDIVMRLEASDGEAQLSIRDSGMGISPETLPRVFDAFVRGARASSAANGLGLGLAIARELVERHGGRIEARSDGPGKGSEFVLHLPRVPEL